MSYGLVLEANPILKNKTEEYNFEAPQIPIEEIVSVMKEKCLKYKVYGLAANQLGIPYSVFCFGVPNSGQELDVFFNPKIIYESEEKTYMDEACLSFPNLVLKIKRSETIRVRMTDKDGKTDTHKFSGLTARIVCHEVDHLNGITFLQRASFYHRNLGLKKRKKLLRENALNGRSTKRTTR